MRTRRRLIIERVSSGLARILRREENRATSGIVDSYDNGTEDDGVTIQIKRARSAKLQ